MEIILQEDVEKLGTRGQVVNVKEGYARNYLLPRKLAIVADASNMKRLEKMRAAFAKKEATERESAQKQADQLSSVALKLSRKAGENEQLFGSVTAGDIADALKAQGYEIDKRKIQLDVPIKTIGEFPITLRLYRDITATVKLTVEREA
ncbi:MAG TPA: 50S ribosomal protein L9 [Candidatus Acidoferrales bacterium]|nr:50S ribosomal protein L9 [Candidatus Acidoferrales bacterium]